MKVFELRKKKGSLSSVYTIALVENPAIEVGFVALSKNQPIPQVKLAIQEEKRMLYTPVLIPNQRIMRMNEQTKEPFQIWFNAETIAQTAHDFIQAKLTDKFNEEHVSHKTLEGVNVVENWIIDDPKRDKAITLGFDLPKGTWMQGIKVNSDATWKDVKAGKYKGISIEGIFDDFETKLNINKSATEMSENKKIATLLSSIAGMFKTKLASQTLADGTVIYSEGELTEGATVWGDEEMTNPFGDGKYEIGENVFITVENGVISAREEVELSTENAELATQVEQLAETVLKVVEQNTALKKEVTALKEVQKEHVAKLAKVSATPSAAGVAKLAAGDDKLSNLQKFLNKN